MSKLEQAFALALKAYGTDLPAPEREYRFVLAEPDAVQQRYLTPKTRKPRAWAYDFAWKDERVAVEVQGGLFRRGGGRHNTRSDKEKMAAAAKLGWHVIQLTPLDLLHSETVVNTVRYALQARKGKA